MVTVTARSGAKLLTVYDWRAGRREAGGRAKGSRVVRRRFGRPADSAWYYCVCVDRVHG